MSHQHADGCIALHMPKVARGWSSQDCHVLAGHSLGGALATLAACDIRKEIPELQDKDIMCYTFGAPRTGMPPLASCLASLYDSACMTHLACCK